MAQAPRIPTDLQLKNMKAPTRRLEIPFGDGLYLVHSPTGAKSWAFRYRAFEKPKKLTLGRYMSAADMLPETIEAGPKAGGPLSIAGARLLAQKARLAVEQGVDPVSTINGDGAKARPRELIAVFDDFVRLHVTPHNRPSTAKETRRLFDKKVRPEWAGRAITSIRRRDIVELLQGVRDDGAPVTANRVLALVRKFFNWCVEQELMETSPCSRVRPPTAEQSRDRCLSSYEISVVWRASAGLTSPFRQWVRILMLTGQRRGEISKLTWSQISKADSQFALPRSDTKNKTPHVVPMSAAVEAELDSLLKVSGSPDYAFTTGRLSPSGELTSFSGFSKVKTTLDTLMADVVAADRARTGDETTIKPIEQWGWHDLRRTMASEMQKMGVEQRVVEKAINHLSGSSSGIVAVYQRYEFMPERRSAFDQWAERVLQLGKEPEP